MQRRTIRRLSLGSRSRSHLNHMYITFRFERRYLSCITSRHARGIKQAGSFFRVLLHVNQPTGNTGYSRVREYLRCRRAVVLPSTCSGSYEQEYGESWETRKLSVNVECRGNRLKCKLKVVFFPGTFAASLNRVCANTITHLREFERGLRGLSIFSRIA